MHRFSGAGFNVVDFIGLYQDKSIHTEFGFVKYTPRNTFFRPQHLPSIPKNQPDKLPVLFPEASYE